MLQLRHYCTTSISFCQNLLLSETCADFTEMCSFFWKKTFFCPICMCLWFNMWTEYPELAHASINWLVVTKSKLGHVMWHTENMYKLVMSPSKYNLGNLITSSSYSKCWFGVIHVLSINLWKFWKDKDECTLHFFWTYHAMSFCLGVSFKNTLKSPKSAHVSMFCCCCF